MGPRPLGPIGPSKAPGPMGPSLGDGESYLQSGKATYCQACTQQPHTCPQTSHRHAPKSRRHAPKSIHRLAPNNRTLCTQPLQRHAPKRRIHAPKSSRIHAPRLCDLLKILKVCRMVQDLSKSVPMVFRSPGNPLIQLFHFIFN